MTLEHDSIQQSKDGGTCEYRLKRVIALHRAGSENLRSYRDPSHGWNIRDRQAGR
jgi:hypothetical protein